MSEFDDNRPEQNQQTDGEMPPRRVDLSGITTDAEEMIDLSPFQHVAPAFFAETKEPKLTLNGKTVTVNAAAVRLFPDVDYMEILIYAEGQKVVFEPTTDLNARAYKWAREKDGKRYATIRSGVPRHFRSGAGGGFETN